VDQSDAVHETSKALNDLTGNPVAFGYSGDVADEDFRRKVYREMDEKCGCVNVCVPAAGITRDGLAVKIYKQIRQVSIYPIESFRLCCGIIHPRLHRYSNGAGLGEKFISEQTIPRTQLRRLIQPEEIADAIRFMISNAAVSGSLRADAGWHPAA